MRTRLAIRLHAILERYFPERRVFLRSDTETRFIRLKPGSQLLAFAGASLVVSWTIIATAILLMDSIGSGNFREQAKRDQRIYEERLNTLSAERDKRAEEAREAQERFNSVLAQVSIMQSELLASETRRREMEKGVDVIQTTLRRIMRERDDAREQVASLTEAAGADGATTLAGGDPADGQTLDFVTAALAETAEERDKVIADAQYAIQQAEEMEYEIRLMQDRNDQIFRQLEDAMSISVEPLDKMFRKAGLNTDSLLDSVRRGYSGQGGPLTPLSISTSGGELTPDAIRANAILNQLDKINLYRLAAERAPFDTPLKTSFRFTSGFGQRWGRLHAGTDFAGAHGSPIYATADGVVIHAGWQSGYGRLVKIQHDFGIETRYAHNSKLYVKKGQRVSRGDKIAAMGNTGRSTGTHLHYEVRVGGKAVNPMTYIKAARDVF
ncbi:peptidoglycan DD-metalloendopeptidase family protein [Roseovarius sp. SCSIO 43702]|uniref:M23 family metallopeptidase n=1 Tax=Roseovarius sp. SCSIO 43702 TaxID=2823043 RepID=UPI001C736E55|nr:M23 family metallopeptidase [Roseovarius sp. SCSIO 43702]QYX56352.1 peptidoglycan DD-metalloendopeptidase family protein [Roseovarius sp. SCSIO 43702]